MRQLILALACACALSACGGSADSGDDYGARSRGFVTAPVSGDYRFTLSADEAAVFSLSDDEEPVNLGAQHEMPIKELVELIAELTGFAGEIRWDATKPDGQPRRGVDPSRAAAKFGFHATTDFRDGLTRTIEWYRNHREEAEAREQ